jgi:transcriptional regulator with XRE-family HTH domain
MSHKNKEKQMPQKTIKSCTELGETIKQRRSDLSLTIVEAAAKAGVSVKTWSRYEQGESIRADKVKGLCKALNWASLPGADGERFGGESDFDAYKRNEAWCPFLNERFGEYAAVSFIIGSEILLDEINDDLKELAKMPKGSHIGEIPASALSDILPQQFLVRYDYEFLWTLRNILQHFRYIAPRATKMQAHSVAEELVLYLIVEKSRMLMDEIVSAVEISCDEHDYESWDEWAFDLFDDMDIATFLYSDLILLTPGDTYHFDNWFVQQFYLNEDDLNT